MGVDMTEIRSRTNDTKSKIVNGVAGLNIATKVSYPRPCGGGLVATGTLKQLGCGGVAR